MTSAPRHSRLFSALLLTLVVALGTVGEWLIEKQANAELRVDVQNRLGQSRERLAATLYAHIQLVRGDRKSTRLNSSHIPLSRMPSSA